MSVYIVTLHKYSVRLIFSLVQCSIEPFPLELPISHFQREKE